MADHAEDLISVIRRVGTPCVAVAHSFGSNPTMLAATLCPDLFAAIGLWEPPIVWVDWWLQSTKDYHAKVAARPDGARSVGDHVPADPGRPGLGRPAGGGAGPASRRGSSLPHRHGLGDWSRPSRSRT